MEKDHLSMSPTQAQDIAPQQTLLDLDTFESVTLVKPGKFVPVANAEEFNQRIGSSVETFLKVVNDGLRAHEYQRLKADETIPWYVKNEDGTVGEVYSGTPADPELINPLVLNFAKSACGYLQAKNADEKRAAKEKAINAIKSSPVILDMIKSQALAAAKTGTASE